MVRRFFRLWDDRFPLGHVVRSTGALELGHTVATSPTGAMRQSSRAGRSNARVDDCASVAFGLSNCLVREAGVDAFCCPP